MCYRVVFFLFNMTSSLVEIKLDLLPDWAKVGGAFLSFVIGETSGEWNFTALSDSLKRSLFSESLILKLTSGKKEYPPCFSAASASHSPSSLKRIGDKEKSKCKMKTKFSNIKCYFSLFFCCFFSYAPFIFLFTREKKRVKRR